MMSLNSFLREVLFTNRRMLALGCLWLLASCTPGQKLFDNTYNTQGKPPTPNPAPSATGSSYRYPQQAPVVDTAGLQDFAGKYRPRVVLLDFWATWSRTNREELQHLARMQDEMRADGFQVIACNMDAEDRWSTHVLPMLNGSGGNYPCVVIPEAERPALRAWLSPSWNYDLPARFIIDRTGRITTQAMTASGAELEQQVRQVVRSNLGAGERARLASTEVGIRLRLIDVSSGEAQSLGEVIAKRSDTRTISTQAAARIAAKIDRARNPRIAIAPFGASRGKASQLGSQLAGSVVGALRDQGFYDLVEPARTQRMISDAGQSTMTVEYEPSLIEGRITADYLVLGWIRGDVADEGSGVPATLVGDQTSGEPDSDSALRPRMGR